MNCPSRESYDGEVRQYPAMEEALVPGYEVLNPIGQGGQAKVYLAERQHDGLRVALKVLDRRLRQDAVFLERFVREYKLIASLENEHVARVYDQGFSGEYPYIAMEYLPAGTVATRIHEGMSSRVALRVTSQIARALDAIHTRGIVHRDLKPANILFRSDGRPVIVDFGLAKDLGFNSTLTLAGQLLATPRYMSPEQCVGHPVDARSDLYSLGAVFYEMLTGEKLFAHESQANLMSMHLNAPIPRLPGRLSGYQPILDRLLAKRPEERFQSARQLFNLIAV
jgi:serine/threonine-protein kinase PpkA